jgi:hypothetical protein
MINPRGEETVPLHAALAIIFRIFYTFLRLHPERFNQQYH